MVGDIETGNNVTEGGGVKDKKEGPQDRTLGYTMYTEMGKHLKSYYPV